MQLQQSLISPHAQGGMSPQRMTGIAFVALLHVVLIYALVTGLTGPIIRYFDPPPIIVLPPVVEPPPTAKPPRAPTFRGPKTPTAPEPKIPPISNDGGNAIKVQPLQGAGGEGIVPASALGGTHSTPDYPPLARTLGEQGIVVLQLTISASGDVTGAQVIKSSGVAELDRTAVSWVIAHWKYKPAIQDGTAVASSADAAVMFSLKNVR